MAGIVVGVCNGSRGDKRTKEHYPFVRGWHGTGAKDDVASGHDPITAAKTDNRLTCMRLECAFLKVLGEECGFNILNTNDGGGGALGLKRKSKKDDQGKQVYVSDPQGYRVYVVYNLVDEGPR